MFPVVILAGGQATRLRPLTENVPKALLDVNGEPFIVHQLRLLRDSGIRRALLCLGYRAEQVLQLLGNGARLGLELDYALDGPRLLGTAGAIRQALPRLPDAFFVLYGDSYLECNYPAVQEAFCASGRAGLMTVLRNQDRWDASNVEFADGRIRAYDKINRTPRMQHIDYGLGVFRRSAFADLPADEPTDVARVYADLLRAGELAAFEVHERFYEIGSPQGLEDTRRYLAARQERRRSASLQFVESYLRECQQVIEKLDPAAIDRVVDLLAETRAAGGRLFILGVGGSAANASHAVNDFRKIAQIETYTPTDNVSELTARTNDDGWPSVFVEWLRGSRLRPADMLLVFSVGGGHFEKNVSPNLVAALQYAKQAGARIGGIVGRDGGYTARVAHACILVPTVNPAHVTPHTEAFQAIVWHLLVSHPRLKAMQTKWESVQ